MKRRKNHSSALLAETTEVEGHLSFNGWARVEGLFTGEITGGGLVDVGAPARVQGDIRCPEIILEGRVDGDIEAARRVEIRPGARIRGTVRCPVLVVAEGALLDGRCVMTGDAEGESSPVPV